MGLTAFLNLEPQQMVQEVRWNLPKLERYPRLGRPVTVAARSAIPRAMTGQEPKNRMFVAFDTPNVERAARRIAEAAQAPETRA